MSRGLNQVTLIGHLGADPETRHTSSGTAITNLRIATSEQWTDKQSGEKQERTEWHRVKLFGKLAEIAGEYLKKGRQVFIQGSLRTDKYTDKDGIERYATDIIANELQMLGGGGENESRGGGNQGARQPSGHGQHGSAGGQNRPAQGASGHRNQSHHSGQRKEPEREPAFAGGGTRGSDDFDIPFAAIPLRQLW